MLDKALVVDILDKDPRWRARARVGRTAKRIHQIRAHHLVVFVVDDMAVPDVAVPAVRVKGEVSVSCGRGRW